MGKFKVGDRVRRVKHSWIVANCPIGHETEVEDLTGSGFWYAGADGKRQNTPAPYDWELVAPAGPVRTVTRTEIVPGVYGRIGVDRYVPEHMAGNVAIRLADKAGNVEPGPIHWLSPSELTDAIATLTAIRDALAEAA